MSTADFFNFEPISLRSSRLVTASTVQQQGFAVPQVQVKRTGPSHPGEIAFTPGLPTMSV